MSTTNAIDLVFLEDPRQPYWEERLVGACQRALNATLFLRNVPNQEREDLKNIILADVFRYQKNYDPTKGAPHSWILGIAHRKISEFIRQQRYFEDLDSVPASFQFLDAVDARDALRDLTLAPRERELFELLLAEVPSKEISEKMGYGNPKSLKWLRSNLYRKIRKQLGDRNARKAS